MICFKDWKLVQEGALPAMQYDHLSCRLYVQGPVPDDYDWTMLVKAGDAMNLIPMEAQEDGLAALLTAEELSQRGYYQMQLRGVRGEEIRHTNVIRVFVEGSLSGDAQWPSLPTAFSQLEQRIAAAAKQADAAMQQANEAADRAQKVAVRTPEIREGTWWVYDQEAGAYQDTGIAAQMSVSTPDWTQNDAEATDYIKNRTHYEYMETVLAPLELQWDGDLEGKECAVIPADGMDFRLCKVSEAILSAEDLAGSVITLQIMSPEEEVVEKVVVGEFLPLDDLATVGVPITAVTLEGLPLLMAVQEPCSFMGCDFTPGVWFFRMEGDGEAMRIAGMTTDKAVIPVPQKAVKKLDNQYLEPFAMEEIPAEVLYPETVIMFGSKKLTLAGNLQLSAGRDYVVTYNKTAFTVRCEAMELDGQAGYALGNQRLAGGADTGEAFLIVSLPAVGQIVFYVASIATLMHSFEVKTPAMHAYKLGNQYLGLDRSWMPETLVSEMEIVSDMTAVSGQNSLGREFHTMAFALGNRYVVTWNGTEYECIATGVVMGTKLVDLLIGSVPLAFSNTEIPDTGEPFCFRLGVNAQTGEISNCIMYAVEGGVYSIRGDSRQQKTLPYHVAPAAYMIPTDLAAGKTGTGDTVVPYEEMHQAVTVLQAGAKVYGTYGGAAVEILAAYPDAGSGNHSVVYRMEDGSVYATDCGTAAKPKTPAVQRDDIVLMDSDETAYRIFAQPEGTLKVANAEGTMEYQIPRVKDKALILESSTSGSVKRFRVTVDDSGTLRAEEMVE